MLIRESLEIRYLALVQGGIGPDKDIELLTVASD